MIIRLLHLRNLIHMLQANRPTRLMAWLRNAFLNPGGLFQKVTYGGCFGYKAEGTVGLDGD